MSLLTYTHDLLTHEDFLTLVVKAQAGDERARASIIEQNIRLVMKHAFNAHKRLVTVDIEDLIQYGVIGLMKSIDKYDPEKLNPLTGQPFAFSTYATWWIKQQMDRECAMTHHHIRLPVHIIKKFSQFKQVLHYMYSAGIPTTDANIEEASIGFKFSANELRLFRQVPTTCAEERLVGSAGRSQDSQTYSVYEQTEDEHSDFAEALEREDFYTHLLETCKDVLTPKEYDVIQLRFGLNGFDAMTLEEVGVILNVTRERIRQIQCQSLSKLRKTYIQQFGEKYVETAFR